MINIAKDYRKYSSEELRSLAYSGLLECNGYDLDSFLEYLFQGMYSEQDLEKKVKEAEDNYDCDCYIEQDESSLEASVRRVIKILEAELD